MYGKATKAKADASGPYDRGNPACKVYVGGLNFKTGWERVKEHMEQAGSVTFAKVLREHKPGSPGGDAGWWSKGTGFVEYSTPEEAQVAVEMLNGSELDGKNIVVDPWSNTPKASGKINVAGGGCGGRATPCPYFPLGKCEKGLECKWSHVTTAGGSFGGGFGNAYGGGPSAGKLCPYFPMGKCDKGAQCKWLHATGAPGGFGGSPMKMCPYFPMGKCDKGKECKWLHVAAGAAGGNAKMCPYFPLGKCDKGAGCKWVHAGANGGSWGAANGAKLCPYFPLGKCDKGAECKWVHAGGEKNGTKMCPYFPQGKCDKGDACKWTH